MTENNHLIFNAIIRISLPDSPNVVTANVTLAAADAIPTADGRYKPLSSCTLADLKAYADQLEADIWETYQEIKLVDLANDESVDVAMTVTDASGKQVPPSKEWFQKAIILPAMPQPEAAAVAEELPKDDEVTFVAAVEDDVEPEDVTEVETAVSLPLVTEAVSDTSEEPDSPEAAAEPELKADEEPVEEAAADEKPVTPDDEDELIETRITVSEPEPTFDEAESAVDPWIQPSTARVRVAGRRLPMGTPTWAAVDILMDESALRSAQAHALTSLDREVAGVLIGPRPEKQPDGRYVVHIIDTIIAKHTVMQGASVTYTPESWRYMNDKLWERYPDETAVIVGWYHTHPGFGIFLSGMDQFIHQNFFTQIWHIAYVLDPRARTSGFFSWDRQKTRVSPFEFQWPSWAAKSW